MVHDEWLRAFYEWGFIGFLLWCAFWASIIAYAIKGVRNDLAGRAGAWSSNAGDWQAAGRASRRGFTAGYAKPLMIYVPGLLVALAGENFIAGAGNAMSLGFLMLLGFATLAHRYPPSRIDPLAVEITHPELVSSPAL
jgi:hypothetical protein